jgi:hypothetical protein
LLRERQQESHEATVRRPAPFLALRLGRPGLDGIGGLPDSRVGVRWIAHGSISPLASGARPFGSLMAEGYRQAR